VDHQQLRNLIIDVSDRALQFKVLIGDRPEERDAIPDERQVTSAVVLAFVGFDFLTALPKFRRSGRSA
jgi:hypothetical protein